MFSRWENVPDMRDDGSMDSFAGFLEWDCGSSIEIHETISIDSLIPIYGFCASAGFDAACGSDENGMAEEPGDTSGVSWTQRAGGISQDTRGKNLRVVSAFGSSEAQGAVSQGGDQCDHDGDWW